MLKGKNENRTDRCPHGRNRNRAGTEHGDQCTGEYLLPMGLDKSPAKMLNSINPYYQTILGGLLLFDAEIEENANNVYPPSV